MIKNKTGVWGEVYAARYLRENGYKIITTNYICHFGEIDIIAEKGGKLRFIEVKARGEDFLMRPEEAVDEIKQRRIALTANYFMTVMSEERTAAFDVCEVYLGEDDKLKKINYIPDAFEEA